MVAADRARQAGRHRDNQQLTDLVLEYDDRNRDEDTEGAPGSAGCKGEAERHHEENRGHQHDNRCVAAHDGINIAADVQVIRGADARQRPRQAENHNGGHHRFEAFGEGLAELPKGQDTARHIHDKSKYQCEEGAKHQRR